MPNRGNVDDLVAHEVALWLRWVPRWTPPAHRSRSRLCKRCFGSPVLVAAGLDQDVPHGVQHALSMRMKRIIDDAVDDYTERNLPNLHREIQAAERANARRRYRAGEGLDPEHLGLDLDPEPEPGQPFLFTLEELDLQDAAEHREPAAPFSEEQKQALRAEIAMADDYAKSVGQAVCAAVRQHRLHIERAVLEVVEPQIAELMADLERELNAPNWIDASLFGDGSESDR
ncbi:MAG TPA: spermidine/putrescine ABC transporter substrate-binding protein [Microbacteriaceae bacterium]|nr:spermidine/putrescine ABC transporter substrate-binding protein [Microbacteriaceae bacterium]